MKAAAEIRARFEAHGQGQVFRFWETLTEEERDALLAQADGIDLEELDQLVATLVVDEASHPALDYDSLEPAPYEPIPSDPAQDAKWQDAKQVGEAALRAGRVAAFTVAGGQGTRLGFDGPKGTFPVSPIRGKSLFQLFAEKIQAARTRYGCALPWYVMTSDLNHEATEAFFAERGYFGMEPNSVRFFQQGRMPAVDFEGKILLESKDRIAMSPDGHGGSLRALARSGALAEMEAGGIDILSYFQVDNPLVQAIDPYFIGFHEKSGSSMSSKMLPKRYEKEKLGHFCMIGDRMEVVEYSDMPEHLTAQRDESGELRFRAGSIAVHILSLPFARKLTDSGSSRKLPFHKAVKKIPFANAQGLTEVPEEPNGVKFEMFVFDALPFAGKPSVVETTRLGDFSPVKNKEGVDSPESCQADQQRLFALWLQDQGLAVETDGEGVPVKTLEISPLFGDTLENFRESWEARKPEVDLSKPLYLE